MGPGGPESVDRFRFALAIPLNGGKVGDQATWSRSVYLDSLQSLLNGLILEDPEQARCAMEMSLEYLPELYSIAQTYHFSDWAGMIRWSDTLMMATDQLDFSQPGTVEEFTERDLSMIFEKL